MAADDKARFETEMQELKICRYESRKKLIAVRDPHAPKAAKSAFMYILEAKRDDILREKPGIDPNQIAQEVGRIWNALSPADKQPWKDLAAEDKARYGAEMQNYEPVILYHHSSELGASVGSSSKSSRRQLDTRKPKRRKNPNTPKAPRTAFIFFSSEKRNEICAQFPELPFADQMKRIGRMWNEMSAHDKQEWMEKSRLDKLRFDRETLEYTDVGSMMDHHQDHDHLTEHHQVGQHHVMHHHHDFDI